jgi:hypothetical protein
MCSLRHCLQLVSEQNLVPSTKQLKTTLQAELSINSKCELSNFSSRKNNNFFNTKSEELLKTGNYVSLKEPLLLLLQVKLGISTQGEVSNCFIVNSGDHSFQVPKQTATKELSMSEKNI